MNITDALSKTDLFSTCGADEIGIISGYSHLRTAAAGEVIAREGDMPGELFLVIEGRVSGTMKLPGSVERKHGDHITGSFFGETSVFGKKPLADTFVAAEESTLILIGEEAFTALIESSPVTATRIISTLLGRTVYEFRKTSGFLADVVQWGEKASRRVITDEQTGIYNRAFLDDAIENFFNISMSNSKPLSLLMLDLDNCRRINELIGHDTGNIIISEFASIIKRTISRLGIVARYGGDEFSVLLPETDLSKAREIAEEIRSLVEKRDFSPLLQDHDIKITTSIGISSYPETAKDLASFKAAADASLYRAKELGRNRVEPAG